MNKLPISGALAGAAGGALLGAAIFAAGAPPMPTAKAAAMASSLEAGREIRLVGSFGLGLGTVLVIWFLGALRRWLREASGAQDEGLAEVAFGSGLVGVVFAAVGCVLLYGASYDLAAEGGSGALRALVDAANASFMLSKFAWAGIAVASSTVGLKSRELPRWLCASGLVAAAVLVGSSVGLFTEKGFSQSGGPLDMLGAASAAVWSVALVVVLSKGSAAASSVAENGVAP